MERWFCCQCGDGPKLVKNNPQCLRPCNHTKCAKCRTEVPKNDHINVGGNASGCNEDHYFLPVPAHSEVRGASNPSFQTPGSFMAFPRGREYRSSCSTATTTNDSPDPTRPLILTNLAANDLDHGPHHHFTLPPTDAFHLGFKVASSHRGDSESSGSSFGEGDREVYWYCCECGTGPNNVALHLYCPVCPNKRKCVGCQMEEFVKK